MSSIAQKARKVELVQESPNWLAVYAGRRCTGHVLCRDRADDVVGFDVNDQPLGIFPDLESAAAAVMAAARL